MFFCIFVSMGYVTLAQNTSSGGNDTTERDVVRKKLEQAHKEFRMSGAGLWRPLSKEEKLELGLPVRSDATVQDDLPKDGFGISEFNRWYKELQEKDWLERQKSHQALREWRIANNKDPEDDNSQPTAATAQDNPHKPSKSIILAWEPSLEERQISSQKWSDFFANIKAPGDANVQLQCTIRMNRPGKYRLGEPIFIRSYVKNLTDYFVLFTETDSRTLFSAVRVSLVDAAGNEISMTCFGQQEVESTQNGRIVAVFREEGSLQPRVLANNERELKANPIVLNNYFDLTQPGIYHLTFHRISFHETQRYDEPLASNTLVFEVLDEFVTPDDLRDPGEFNWPPSDTVKPDAE